jgi:transposase
VIEPAHKASIIALREKGHSSRTIAKILDISRNTVRGVLAMNADPILTMRRSKYAEIIPILPQLFERCKGNAVRIQEILKEEYQFPISYTRLKDLIRVSGLRGIPKRVGEYCFEPGQEMQHDTSPHKVTLGDKRVIAQCASLVLGYSRQLYMQYYPRFTRFDVKVFLSEALEFMQGSCGRCIVDNTSVVLAGGSGPDAVISAEMLIFSKMYGFEFIAHRIMHSDRKGKIERPFRYIENNFIPGRIFTGWDDLNQQARKWCTEISNKKEKRILEAAPEALFAVEKQSLIPLPEVLPPIYEHTRRQVDSKGYISLETNRYSVPERLIGKSLDVYKHPKTVEVYYQHKSVAQHPRFIAERNKVNRLPGHHSRHHEHQTNEVLKKVEGLLSEGEEILAAYTKALKKHVRGSGLRSLTRLLNLKRSYPAEAFSIALKKAHHYGLYDLHRLESMIIKSVAGNYFNLQEEEL